MKSIIVILIGIAIKWHINYQLSNICAQDTFEMNVSCLKTITSLMKTPIGLKP
jgi:hypothetical protein